MIYEEPCRNMQLCAQCVVCMSYIEQHLNKLKLFCLFVFYVQKYGRNVVFMLAL